MRYLTSPNLVVRDIRNQLEKVESQLQIATTEENETLGLIICRERRKARTERGNARPDAPTRGKRAENSSKMLYEALPLFHLKKLNFSKPR